MSDVRWIQSWPDDRAPYFRVGRMGSELIAEWVGFATLRSSRDGTSSKVQIVDEATDPELIEKFYRGQVQGLLRHLRGGLAMHASAAALGGRAVALLGESGMGKSTMAAALCVVCGGEFMADDALPVEVSDVAVRVSRIETHHWLIPESAEALGLSGRGLPLKQPISPVKPRTEPAPLAAIVKLTFDDGVQSSELSALNGQERFRTLSLSMMRFILDEQEVMLRDFQQVSALAERVPLFELRRPPGVDRVANDARKIAALLGSPELDGTSSGAS